MIKRGLALTRVKFGISSSSTAYNRASSALVYVYHDGSVGLNHGGTEMGQGLYVKVAQAVAEDFQSDADRVRITATSTGKVPNASAAAAPGADLNGMAARAAARILKERLVAFRVTGLSEAALARLVRPTGGTSVRDKRPAVIAALVAAERIGAFARRCARPGPDSRHPGPRPRPSVWFPSNEARDP